MAYNQTIYHKIVKVFATASGPSQNSFLFFLKFFSLNFFFYALFL